MGLEDIGDNVTTREPLGGVPVFQEADCLSCQGYGSYHLPLSTDWGLRPRQPYSGREASL